MRNPLRVLGNVAGLCAALLPLLLRTRRGAAPGRDRGDEQIATELRDAALGGDDMAWEWVSELTTRFGPRPAGSASELHAAEWAVKRLKALGLENVHSRPSR